MRHQTSAIRVAVLLAFVATPLPTGAQSTPAQPTAAPAVDAEYTAKIRELTPTDPRWKFTTELVDYLPASATVPTPLKVLGYVPGTIGRLSHVAEINRYFRAVAEAAVGRTRLMSLGMSDENREELVLAVADEETIRRLDEYRAMAARLADPRGMSPTERARLIREAKPIYWVLGSIHSPETGSPEMLMELAYRLAVDDGDFVRSIRSNVITLITPVQEVDGRDRMVDVYNQSKMLKVPGRSLVYWGKYTAHDNNRDGMVVSQKITQNYLKGFLHWRPTITHDLHESVPFLYISTGTGPYNDEFDPITIAEWHTLAYNEITELTRRGLAGVWTHGFYDGWAPNYVMSITQFHNSTGRFYETYTANGADCQTVTLGAAQSGRTWYRPNPAVSGVRWCIRSNLNYQQSGVLLGLKYVGDHRTTFVENNIAKAERMIARGKTSAPYAFVIPREQRHAAEAADLVNLFRLQAAEVHEATSEFSVQRGPRSVEDRGPHQASVSGAAATAGTRTPGARAAADSATPPAAVSATGAVPTQPAASDSGGRVSRSEAPDAGTGPRAAARASLAGPVTVRAGDWIVRMDQPYTQMIRTMLAIQRYKPDDPPPYDDTGWTIDELRHVETYTITDSTILAKPMRLITADATVAGRVTGSGSTLLVRHLGDWRSAAFPWKAGVRVSVADTAFSANGASYPAGTFIVADAPRVRAAILELGLTANATAAAPPVRSHPVTLPRIAYIHTWQETQNEGWVRFSLDRMGIPYTYMSDQQLRNARALDRYDVVIFPHSGQGGMSLVNGRPMIGPAIPWRASPRTPHLGKWDETDDIRPGMGLEGAANVRRFVERGGLLLVEGSTSRFPIELGLTPGITEFQSRTLGARGAIFRAEQVTSSSPILYGYDANRVFPVYFNQTPLLQVQSGTFGQGGQAVDSSLLAAQDRARPRVILRFLDRADSLGVSGMLNNPQDLQGRPAVIDAPLGNGHVVMFAIRPFWRYQTQGSWAMALNAIANWNMLTDPCVATACPAPAGRVTDAASGSRE
jgi:hypothetical protein